MPSATGTAQAAYKRGVPLVYHTSEVTDDGGGVVIVLHGQNNRKASLIDGQSLNADESSTLASRSLIGLNGTHSSADYWDTRRVVVAAMFQIGYLVNQDKAMARHMLRNMSERERSFGFNGALEECLGQNPELLRAIIELGAKPNEETFSDGMLPLENAIRRNSKATVEILLEKGARLDLDTSSSGLTPQECAEKFGSIEVKSRLAAWARK
jgi:ankyrin repeat protein